MIGKILGLDISDAGASAVLIKKGMQGSRMLDCRYIAFASTDQEYRKERLNEMLGDMDLWGASCVTAVPSWLFSYRLVSLPFKDLRKMDQILPYEIEPTVLEPVDEMVVDFVVVNRGKSGMTTLLVAALTRETMREILAFYREVGVVPEKLGVRNVALVHCLLKQPGIPSVGMLLDVTDNRVTMLLYGHGKVLLMRRLSFPVHADFLAKVSKEAGENLRQPVELMASECQNTLRSFNLETGLAVEAEHCFLTGEYATHQGLVELLESALDMNVRIVNAANQQKFVIDSGCPDWIPEKMNNALALALRPAKATAGFDFLKGEFAFQRPFARYRRLGQKIAVMTVVFLTLAAVDIRLELNALKNEFDGYREQTRKIFTQTLPEVTRIVDPVHQLRIKVNELKGTSSSPDLLPRHKKLDLIENISALIPAEVDLLVSRLTVDGESMRIKGRTDNFNAVDMIKKSLDTSAYFSDVTIASANLERNGDKILFEMRLQQK